MRFIPNNGRVRQEMLAEMGVSGIADLFASIPEDLRLGRPLKLPDGMAEMDQLDWFTRLASRNQAAEMDSYLGAGAYTHFTPLVADALIQRGEFFTAYTPYQPELAQGTLQAIFEFQSFICLLTGMDVANASVYDGASATAEAVLMADRLRKGRNRILLPASLHPHYREVIETYTRNLGLKLETIPRDETTGRLDLAAAAEAARARGALLVVCVAEALSLALLRPPGELGADIVCGEAQSFGLPMGFGGPHLGFLATRQKHVRQMPGRLVGQTADAQGRRGFVLTLSTREQHIRRERATSNICTNQGLCQLMATVYLALLGRVGLRRLAEANVAKAEYAKARVRATPGLSLPLSAPTFNEFAVGLAGPAEAALRRALDAGIVGGLDLATFAPELEPAVLVCTTERVSREQIDGLVAALAGGAA